MKKILLILIIFTSCTKESNTGKLKYEILVQGAPQANNYVVTYTDPSIKTEVTQSVSAGWSKEFDITKSGDCYFFQSGGNYSTVDIITKIYFNGKVVSSGGCTACYYSDAQKIKYCY